MAGSVEGSESNKLLRNGTCAWQECFREGKGGECMKDLLAAISVCGFIVVSVLAFLAAKFGVEWAKAMMDTILPMVVQTWVINFTTIVNYHYGSSAGSSKKTDLLAKADPIIDLLHESK